VQLVEQHCIRKSDPRYAIIDDAAFKSKNLYNAGNYEYRQAFIHEGTYLNYHEVQKRMQSHEAYLEARGGHGQAQQPELCQHSSCTFH
jgi:putative transposase